MDRANEAYKVHIQYTFNAFCKIVIRHAAIDKILNLRRRWEREVSLDYLMNEKFVQLAEPEQLEEYLFTACDQTAVLYHAELAAALARLPEQTQEEIFRYIKNEIGFLMAALASAYSLFDNRSGARFEILKSLKECSHPIPAIRMYYAEEIVEGSLKRFFESEEEFEIIESEWLKVVCDVEAEHKGNIAQGNVFYYPAFTECAQEHLSELKHYMIEMYETLQPLSLSNFAEKLENEDAEIQTEAIWFTETGVGLRTWMKSKNNHRRVKKPGVNALCPCGSGKKFKKCCRGNGRYD